MARPRRWVSRCTSRSRRRRRRSVSPRASPRTPSFPTAPSIPPHPRSRCAGDNAPGGQAERCRPPWSRRWRRRGAAPALARRRMRRLSACDYRAPSAAAAAGAIGETRCALSARGGEKEGRGGGLSACRAARPCAQLSRPLILHPTGAAQGVAARAMRVVEVANVGPWPASTFSQLCATQGEKWSPSVEGSNWGRVGGPPFTVGPVGPLLFLGLTCLPPSRSRAPSTSVSHGQGLHEAIRQMRRGSFCL